MTQQEWFLVTLLSGMSYLFFTQKLPLDLTSFVVLAVLILTGMISPQEALVGFSSSAVVTMIATFFVTGAMRKTGIADGAGRALYFLCGESEKGALFLMCLLAAFFSSFMNNVAATALLMPAVVGFSELSRIPPSKLLMPLSFSILLGGTTTLIGTTTNLLAADLLRTSGEVPFSFLEFCPIGVPLVGAGTLFFVFIGRHLLPSVNTLSRGTSPRDLPAIYRLHERLSCLRVPHAWTLRGQSLAELQFGERLGVEVVVIFREGRRIANPSGADTVKGGDRLIVRGRGPELQALLRLRGVVLATEFHPAQTEVSGVRLLIQDERLMGIPLGELALRERFGVVIVAILRHGQLLTQNLPMEHFEEGDEVYAVVAKSQLETPVHAAFLLFERQKQLLPVGHPLTLFTLRLPNNSALDDISLFEAQLGKLAGLQVLSIVREGISEPIAAKAPVRLRSDDILIVLGDPAKIELLTHLGELESEELPPNILLESSNIAIHEVALSPRSSLVGQTLRQVNFRERYGCQVLAIWRDGYPRRDRIGSVPLEFGDALLLKGPRDRLQLLLNEEDFIVLTAPPPSFRIKHWPVALLGLLLLTVLPATGIQPVEVCALYAGLLVVLGGAISMEEAYREVEWRVVALIVAMIPIGLAVQKTPLLDRCVEAIMSASGAGGASVALALLIVTSSVVSQLLDNTVAVVLLVPLALQLGKTFGVDPHAFPMAVTIGASLCFLAPFSHRANLLVMNAGGYTSRDFLPSGFLLTVISVTCVYFAILWTYGL